MPIATPDQYAEMLDRAKAGKFAYQYMEVDGTHGSMVPLVWPAVFDFFDKVAARKKAAK